jgi:hypothetical protein
MGIRIKPKDLREGDVIVSNKDSMCMTKGEKFTVYKINDKPFIVCFYRWVHKQWCLESHPIGKRLDDEGFLANFSWLT